jgi:Fic family protein
MNDTIDLRQGHILSIINQSGGLSRNEIQEKVNKIYKLSKITLIRELNVLVKKGLIKRRGRAKATQYFAAFPNPLFRYFDLNQYFETDPDRRTGVRINFETNIFKYLHSLILKSELQDLHKSSFSFKERAKHLHPDILRRELERFIIEFAWKSSKIEGNTYTLLETESLIKEQREARGKLKKEAIMILNHKSVFDVILKNKIDFRDISVVKISQLHNALVKDLSISTGIRKQAVGITGTLYRPPDNEFQIREFFEKTIGVVNQTKSPFEKALIAQFMVSYLQPYSDGNKRTGRMLANAILLANDLFPISYRSVEEDEFKKALILFYEQLSIIHIKRLFIEQVKFANATYFK